MLSFKFKNPSPPPNVRSNKIAVVDREVWLDWARTFAVMSIVFCHCVERSFNMSLIWFNEAPHGLRFIRDLLFTFGRLGVPVFLLLSGYLLLSRHRCKELSDVFSFYKTKWLPLLICWLLWIVIYALINGLALHPTDPNLWASLGRQLIFREPPNFMHVWYMPMIIGVYLVIPLISMLIEIGKQGMFWLLMSLSCFATLLGEFTMIDLTFICDRYLAYILLGYLAYLLAPYITAKRALFLIILSLCIAFGIAKIYYNYHKAQIDWHLWYTDKRLIFGSLILFLSWRVANTCNFRIIKSISRGAFAIYLMHAPVQMWLIEAKLFEHISSPIAKTFIQFICTFITTYLLYLALCKIKPVARYLFLGK